MTLNINKTHSERLMPLIDIMLTESGVERETIGGIAVASGPGSFTGLRIGVATARGLSQALGIPAVPVCTLSALAGSLPLPGTLLCPILDARRNQVYTALYKRSTEEPYELENLLEPAAISIYELISYLESYNETIVFLGEGLHVYSSTIRDKMKPGKHYITPAPFRVCRAVYVAMQGKQLLLDNPNSSYQDLQPFYLRRPEAERLAEERKGIV